MKRPARALSRLATATRAELPALRIAFQFLRAMLAVPRMPQRQGGCAISWPFDGLKEQGATEQHTECGGEGTLPFRRTAKVCAAGWSKRGEGKYAADLVQGGELCGAWLCSRCSCVVGPGVRASLRLTPRS